MLLLILNSRTAIRGAYEGVELCIRTVVPSLFPFLVLSGYLLPFISKLHIPWLAQLLNIPDGWESVFLLGCIGGYPIGTQCICQGYKSGTIERSAANSMLGFCTNCGPAFLFGVVGQMLGNMLDAVAVTAIMILSALLVGALRTHERANPTIGPSMTPLPFPAVILSAIRSMGSICAWVVLGKLLLAYVQPLLDTALPADLSVLICGLLELTNGCIALPQLSNDTWRFTAACILTGFGGFCVAMQVSSLCADAGLDASVYLLQKGKQGFICAALALLYQFLPFTRGMSLLFISVITLGIIYFGKKMVAFLKELMYNRRSKGGRAYAVP